VTSENPDEQTGILRHEEELEIRTAPMDAGSVRIRKGVDTEHVTERIDSESEAFDRVDHMPANPGDSGEIETLPDGSISIPILEEQLVISKRLVVRERIIVRKVVNTQQHVVEAELRRERVAIDGDVEQDHPAPPALDER
jgi:uncharacterized protein (TIGR02271 family)